jgi:ferric-chelate reductase (NADPH)
MSKHKKRKHHETGTKKKGEMLAAEVRGAEWVGDNFRLVDLLAKGCREEKWRPGAKLKVDVGDGTTRTFTPISMKAKSGRVRILVYIHGPSPASQWASTIRSGDKTYTSVPRSSLDVNDLRSPVVFFGDETSFGTAKTLQSHLGADFPVYCSFEVKEPRQAQAVVKKLELANVTQIKSRENRSHLDEIVRNLQRAMTNLATKHLIMTGNGRSIQGLRAALQANNATQLEYVVKAYWTPEKKLRD